MKTISGGRYPVVIERGQARHQTTGAPIYLCDRCPFGTADAMFLSERALALHLQNGHGVMPQRPSPQEPKPELRRRRRTEG